MDLEAGENDMGWRASSIPTGQEELEEDLVDVEADWSERSSITSAILWPRAGGGSARPTAPVIARRMHPISQQQQQQQQQEAGEVSRHYLAARESIYVKFSTELIFPPGTGAGAA